jgi:hypothetical protein
MEGLYFYWLAWIGWILATFFMEKTNPVRRKMAAGILAVLIAVPYQMDVLVFNVNLAAFVIVIFLFFETRKKKLAEFMYLFLSSFIIMLAYASFLIFELLDPVWVLFDRRLMLAVAGFYLSILLQKKKSNRMIILAGGFLQGEILYGTVLLKFQFPYTISSLAFLETLIISVSMIVAWSAIETLISVMSRSTISQVEGEEHKTT